MLRAASGRLRRPGEALDALLVIGLVLGVSAFPHRATADQKTDADRHTYRALYLYLGRYLFRRYSSAGTRFKLYQRLPWWVFRLLWSYPQVDTLKAANMNYCYPPSIHLLEFDVTDALRNVRLS